MILTRYSIESRERAIDSLIAEMTNAHYDGGLHCTLKTDREMDDEFAERVSEGLQEQVNALTESAADIRALVAKAGYAQFEAIRGFARRLEELVKEMKEFRA